MLCTVRLDGRITKANVSLLSGLDTTEADLFVRRRSIACTLRIGPPPSIERRSFCWA